jgi:hypothetical protein
MGASGASVYLSRPLGDTAGDRGAKRKSKWAVWCTASPFDIVPIATE